MRRHLVLIVLTASAPSVGYAAGATVIKDTIACNNIGLMSIAEQYRAEGDELAAKRYIADAARRGSCTTFKKGTSVIFHHAVYYTDGDYGSYTTVRRKGEPRSWVIEKCALDARDPDLARFPEYTTPEPQCEQ